MALSLNLSTYLGKYLSIKIEFKILGMQQMASPTNHLLTILEKKTEIVNKISSKRTTASLFGRAWPNLCI